ncbi:MAG: preprotein translocase subunit SecE [bacterium TMED264]|nr:MAG: preprotein translocase subunit SecE [bacterium TMED264]|tara:strand:+ start:102 stop:284 length:183 start_codon:yes stop_codon:yes gene_type:complete
MVKKIQKFLSDVRFEMSKVSWPTWEELKSSTYVVLTLSLILILFLFVVDFILAKILKIVL